MTTPDEPDLTAAEFALGVLEGGERAAAARRVLAEPAFAREVERWRTHFSALYAQWPEVEPRATAARLAASIAQPQTIERRWRWLAVASSVAAAALLLVVADGWRTAPSRPISIDAPLIAVVTPIQGEPFGATLVRATREVSLSGGVPVPAGRTAQLWAIGTDGVPRAAGLLEHGQRQVVLPAGLPLVAGTTLAISIEPAGGSPKPTPTGPVVATGRLVAS